MTNPKGSAGRGRAARNLNSAAVRNTITSVATSIIGVLPVKIPVSPDPPQVNLNPPRDVIIVGSFEENDVGTVTKYGDVQLFADAAAQLGSLSTRKMLVQSIKVWTGCSLLANATSLTVTDAKRGVKCRDAGLSNRRLGCGIRYPAHLQSYVNDTSSGDLVEIDSPMLPGVIHIQCRIWA